MGRRPGDLIGLEELIRQTFDAHPLFEAGIAVVVPRLLHLSVPSILLHHYRSVGSILLRQLAVVVLVLLLGAVVVRLDDVGDPILVLLRRDDLAREEQPGEDDEPAVLDQLADTRRREPCLLYTSPSPRDVEESRMPSSA